MVESRYVISRIDQTEGGSVRELAEMGDAASIAA
jgi:hypothetical protein